MGEGGTNAKRSGLLLGRYAASRGILSSTTKVLGAEVFGDTVIQEQRGYDRANGDGPARHMYMTTLECSVDLIAHLCPSTRVSPGGRCYLAIANTHRLREYRNAMQNAYEVVISNHERRMLAWYCREWRENVPKQQAATKIQAAWRGSEGCLRAACFRDRETRFKEFAEVLRTV